jgi:hypothetical protein
MRKYFVLAVVILALVVAACKSTPKDETAAIRTALQAYLSQRGNLNLAGMDMDVQVMRMDERTADVQVTFRAKQGGGEMQMAYQLEKQGEGWVVKGSKSPTGASGHPDVGGAPSVPSSGELPAGHPPMTAPQTPPPQQPPTKKP